MVRAERDQEFLEGEAVTDTKDIEIREATSDAELEAIFRFRYEIYVEEMGRKQKYADQVARRITDPLDANGWNVGAWRDGQLVGVVRTNPFDDPVTDEYAALYKVKSDTRNNAVIVTRLMTAPSIRKSDLATRLAVDCHKRICLAGRRDVYIDCNDYLVRWFESLGFRAEREVEHLEYGTVSVMYVDLYDRENFRSCGSPFLASLDELEIIEIGDIA